MGKKSTNCGKKGGTERRKGDIYTIYNSVKVTRVGRRIRREETVMTRLRLRPLCSKQTVEVLQV